MLYLVATPIGHLGDFSFRAVETLKACDYILCEDTRHSRVLMNHYGIKTPLKSFHKFSESSKEDAVIEDIKNGLSVALISDAGTPCIADPGERLVKRCRDEKLPVTTLPGPCAAIAALTISGFSLGTFQFVGFLPKKRGELQTVLQTILQYRGTTICYESPNRVRNVLELLHKLAPKRVAGIARELTKKFEEFASGTANELLAAFPDKRLKGEVVLLISGRAESGEEWLQFSPEEHVAYLQREYHLSKSEAVKLAAEQRCVPKKDVYKAVHGLQC